MKIRQENIENFYPTMLKWADAHMFTLPSRVLMPWDVFVLSDNKGVDQYCVGLHITSHIAITVFPLSNIEANPSVKNLYKLYEHLEGYIKKLNQLEEYNIHIFWTTAGKDGYKKFLEKNKWIKTLTCEDHFVKVIN